MRWKKTNQKLPGTGQKKPMCYLSLTKHGRVSDGVMEGSEKLKRHGRARGRGRQWDSATLDYLDGMVARIPLLE